ncbi:hypothetical protein D3C81_375510 [compost metagenome]
MAGNTSGFAGYSYTNIYPNFVGGATQTAETIAEPEEQQAYVSTDVKKLDPVVDKTTYKNFWIIGAVGIGLIFLLGASK